jgi:hypothetical protein
MANILSKTGILSGSIVQVGHVTQSIDAFTGIQEYDITLSGSLTITGSVILDTTIDKDFYGTASSAITSSTAYNSPRSTYAITTSFAPNETSVLQLYNGQMNIVSGSTFYIGTGTITNDSSSVGFSFPYNSGRIVSASIIATTLGTTGSISADIFLFKNNTKIHDFSTPLQYKFRYTGFVDGLDFSSTASLGDRIYAKGVTISGSLSTNVIHSINLYIQRNG